MEQGQDDDQGGLEEGQKEPPSRSWKELKAVQKRLLEQREQHLEEKEKEVDEERKWQEVYANQLDAIAHKSSEPVASGLARQGPVGKASQWPVACNKASQGPVGKASQWPVAWNKARQWAVASNKASHSPVAWNMARKKSLGRMILPQGKRLRRKRQSSSWPRLSGGADKKKVCQVSAVSCLLGRGCYCCQNLQICSYF